MYVGSAPVTVASALHVCLSADNCSSAFVCAVPVDIMCDHVKVTGAVVSTISPFGEIALAAEIASAVDNVFQSDVVVLPLFAVTMIRHWILVPVKVPAGTVKLLVFPEILLEWIVPLGTVRH